MRRRLRLIVLGSAVLAPWALVWVVLSQRVGDERRADERAIRDVLRGLEQDINRGRLLEIFAHIVHVDSDEPNQELREHALMDSLRELSSIDELDFTVVEIAFSQDGRAMVEARASGVTVTSPGGIEPVSRRILFKFVKQDGVWKIAGKEPEGPIHSLQPLRRARPGGENP
jgi:hypothetical protein